MLACQHESNLTVESSAQPFLTSGSVDTQPYARQTTLTQALTVETIKSTPLAAPNSGQSLGEAALNDHAVNNAVVVTASTQQNRRQQIFNQVEATLLTAAPVVLSSNTTNQKTVVNTKPVLHQNLAKQLPAKQRSVKQLTSAAPVLNVTKQLPVAQAAVANSHAVTSAMTASSTVTPVPVKVDVPKLKKRWRIDLLASNSLARIQPIFDESTVYMATDQHLHAYELDNGKRLWQTPVDARIGAGVALGAGYVFIVSNEGSVQAYNADDGAIVWQVPLEMTPSAVPYADDSRVYVRSANGEITAVHAVTGRKLWQIGRPVNGLSNQGDAPLRVFGEGLLSVYADGFVSVNQPQTGKQFWQKRVFQTSRSSVITTPDSSAAPVFDSNNFYITSQRAGLSAISAKDGSPVWSSPIDSDLEPSLSDNALFVVTKEQVLVALDKTNGALKWQLPISLKAIKAKQFSNPVTDGPLVWVGDNRGKVHAINKMTGAHLKSYGVSSTPITSISVRDKVLYAYAQSSADLSAHSLRY